MAPSRGRKWQTEQGRATIRRIVAEKIPEWTAGLHEWQLIIIAWILDGEDVFCVTATGDGKSALFAVPIIVLLEVAKNPASYPGFSNPDQKTPVGLVIAPTKGLAANIVFELTQLRVQALACTSNTLTEARIAGRNVASEIAACRWPMVIIDPEHLLDKQWEFITNCQLFRLNISFTSVDEAHLIDEWGAEFRPAFRHIGNFLRARLPPHVSVSALTATAEPGAPTTTVCKSLGFQSGMFHMHRRSNERPNVQFLLEPLSHTLGGAEFPDLLRYLAANRKTIIYCATIELCWRVYVYLLRLLPRGPRRLRRVRLYHAMCWPDENEKTVALMRDDAMCQIIVGTVAFGQGFNVKTLLDSIQLGIPKTVAQTIQQGGRVGRDPSTVGRAIILGQTAAYTSAQKFIASGGSSSRPPAKANKSLTAMNRQKALMLTETGCLVAFFNKMFGNTTPGAQLDCIALPRRLPCSNCLPRFSGSVLFQPSPLPLGPERLRPFSKPVPSPATGKAPYQHKNTKLTTKMRASATVRLHQFRVEVQKLEREHDLYGSTPASAYLSNPVINSLLDHLLVIWTRAVLVTKIPQWKYHERRGDALYALIRVLQREFAAEFEATRVETNRKAAEKRLALRVAAGFGSDTSSEGGEESDGSQGPDGANLDEGEPMQEEPTARPMQQPVSGKRRAPLDDTTNILPAAKRARATRTALKSAASVAQTFGPGYKPRVRRGGLQNE